MSLFVYRSRRFNRMYALAVILYTIWFLVGLVVVGAGIDTPFGPWADFTFLALAALVLVLHLAGHTHGLSVLVVFLTFCAISGLVEAVGAATGFPFGSYTYTDRFGPVLFGILPAAIPLAWWVIVWPLHCLVHSARAGKGSVFMVPVLTAVGAVWADFIIEPPATLVREYWHWEGPGLYYGVPWTNFPAWFATAFVLSFLAQILLPHSPFKKEELRVPLWVLSTTLFTFLIVALANGQWLVAGVAAGFFIALWRTARLARSNSLSG
ncbi:MAG: carotenoid biosynthesis protein [Puniceicoccaceae bacterium]